MGELKSITMASAEVCEQGLSAIQVDRASKAAPLMLKAEDMFTKGEFLKAAGAWARAIKLEESVGNDPLLQSNLCYALLKAHKFQKALEAADASLALDATAGRTHYRKGLCHIALDEWDEAVTTLEIAQKLLGSQDSDCASMLNNSRYHCKMMHEKNKTECPASCVDAEDPQAKLKEEKENKKPLSEAEVKAEVKRRMAAKLAAESANRQSFNAKKIKNTIVALQEAQKELITKEKVDEAKKLKEADQLSPELQKKLVSDEGYDQAKASIKDGEALEYDSERVARFAQHELQQMSVDPSKFQEPVAIVLPGVKNDWGDEGQGVNLLGAFESAKQQKNTALWVQQYASQTDSHAIMLVVPKGKLLYPKKLKGWGCSKSTDGHYVQLEARDSSDRRLWWVEAAGAQVHELDLKENANLLDDPKAKK